MPEPKREGKGALSGDTTTAWKALLAMGTCLDLKPGLHSARKASGNTSEPGPSRPTPCPIQRERPHCAHEGSRGRREGQVEGPLDSCAAHMADTTFSDPETGKTRRTWPLCPHGVGPRLGSLTQTCVICLKLTT